MFAINTAYLVVLLLPVYFSNRLFAVRLQLEPGTKAVIKLGVCPYPNYLTRCNQMRDDCADDLDCAHEALCCNDGCHRICLSPRLENIVGYVVLGAELPLNSPTAAPDTGASAHGVPKSLSVSPDSWNLLLGYLCAVSDRLHSTSQFQCTISCTRDSDCPQNSDQSGSGPIKCCNRCCLDPTQFIIQQRTNVNPQLSDPTNGRFNISRQKPSTSNYVYRPSPSPLLAPQPPPLSKPGMCPPVLVQSSNGGMMSGSCDRRCNTDRDCLGLEKCCSNGCGFACQRPISFTLGYGGESLAAAQAPSASNNFFANPTRSAAEYLLQTTTKIRPPNSPMPYTGVTVPPITKATPMTVLLGSPPLFMTTDSTPNSKRCTLPPTSYTECIGITPWRTRYYYHQGLNQCLPIYRCIRPGNNFIDLSSCENCVQKDNSFFY